MNYLNRTTGVLAAAAALACSAAFLAGQANAEEKQMTIAMITHAQPGDTFWDIIRKGANAAAKKDNVKLIYLADPTANKEAQLITNVVQQHVDGIALTLAFPDAEAPAVKAAEKAGIPIVGFNAGVDQWKEPGPARLRRTGRDRRRQGGRREAEQAKAPRTSSASTSSRARCSSRRAATASRTPSRARWRCST